MLSRSSSPRGRGALLIDADQSAAGVAAEALAAYGYETSVVADAEMGLRALGAHEPELLVLDLELRGRDGRWLLRRLRDDFMGVRPRVILHTRSAAIAGGIANLGVDSVVLKPAHPRAVVMAAALPPNADEPGRADRLRELVKLSLLDGELGYSLNALAQRLAIGFRCAECIIAVQIGDRQLTGVARGPEGGEWPPAFGERCRAALEAGAPVMGSTETGVQTLIGIPFAPAGSVQLGYVVLLDDTARAFNPESIDDLRMLTQRLHRELAWRSVHDRIASDRDRLRESSMLDPMLAGVWTRAALEQALPGEVAACERRGEPLTVAVVDLRGLRHLNERHGHVAGDAALRHVAQLVRHSVRTPDLVARHSGDALAVVLPGTPLVDAARVIERIQDTVARTPFEHDGHVIALAITAGVALREDGEGADVTLARAEAALAGAKRRREGIAIAEAASATISGPLSSGEGLVAGTTLGGMYQILHEISRGAMGVVYRAEDLGLGRPVALKTLRPDLARDRGFVQRFRAEAALLASFRHENLVQVYAFGQDGEDVYFVMELVEGEPLEDRIEMARHEGKDIPFGEVERVIVQIGDALDAMHQKGILHRDVKPANILLDRVRDRAVLVDVGIAKRRGTPTDPAGTPGFTAPESFTGGVEGAQADVYGLAATAYMLLTSEMPFRGQTTEDILAAQRAGRPEAASSLRPQLSTEIDEVFAHSLDPQPTRRAQSAGHFARALAAALDKIPEMAVPDHGEVTIDRQATPQPRPRLDASDEVDTDVRGLAPPPAGKPVRAQILQLGDLREPDLPPATVPHTRGVLFRAVYRVLGARNAAQWAAQVGKEDPALGKALQPQTTLLSWHPTEHFVHLLHAAGSTGRDVRKFARELGRVATAATFNRFFGADATALTPWRILSAADVLWRRYHTWGEVAVEQEGETGARILITGGPRDPLVCESSVGILEQVAELAAAPGPRVEHPACQVTGASACTFVVRWKAG
jgi:serine/threonine-protein kinase